VSAENKTLRQTFGRMLFAGLKVVWPILSILLVMIVAVGIVIGLLEGWSIDESLYFSFVTGLTVGYGDFSPKLFLTRSLAVFIAVCGMLLTGLVVAVAVQALTVTLNQGKK
jgi:hypothetical protein